MTESIKLKNVNVFESEEQYNENKDTINVNDLNLVPVDNLYPLSEKFKVGNSSQQVELKIYEKDCLLELWDIENNTNQSMLRLGEDFFKLRAGSYINNDCKYLIGTNDGTLRWDNCSVVTMNSSYRNGSIWYRKYSDGWIEQGGNINAVAPSASLKTITFPTNFSSTSYQFLMTVDGSIGTSGGSSDFCMTTSDKTATSIKVSVHSADIASGTLDWYACGY